jgi:alpha-L-rhamnosidase
MRLPGRHLHWFLFLVALSVQSASWVDPSRYLVLEPKAGAWTAQWIDAGEGIPVNDFGRVFYVRKSFDTRNPAAFSRVYVSADSRYKLWVNGVLAARGPARFDPLHQQYDTLDLSSLIREGGNVIAAEIMYWGEGEPSRGGPIFQMSARPAFVFETDELKSDRTWKALISQGMSAPGWENVSKVAGYFAGNWLEQVDARKLPVGWEQPGFDDTAWSNAREITRAEIWGEGDTRAPWKLLPRQIGPVEERSPEPARAVQSGLVNPVKPKPPFSFEVTPNAGTPSLPITLPGDGQVHYVVFDAGRLVTAFPRLELEAGDGAVVEVAYAEAPSVNFRKDRRDVLADKRVEGINDIYVTRSGRQAFEPFFHRTFWYVRVAVKSDTAGHAPRPRLSLDQLRLS